MARRSERNQKYAALVKEYRQLAKKADQRLVRLERYATREKYKNVLQYAYAKAQRDIRSWSGDKATRFNTKPPSSLNSLQAKINDINDFLRSATSSIKPTQENAVRNEKGEIIGGGIDLTYQKRADTLNQKYGTDLTWENVGSIFESTLYKKLSKKYSSKTAVRIIGKLQGNEKRVVRSFKKHEPVNVKISGEGPLEEAVNKTLRYYKKDISSLYGAL